MRKPKDKSATSLTGVKARRNAILTFLKNENSVTVGFLSEKLNVSEVTIRKDLILLETENKLYRSHGKAFILDPYINNRHVSVKAKIYVSEKAAIAKHAVKYLTDGDSIILASGTTTLELAREIGSFKGALTVITPSVQISSMLSQYDNVEVIQLGGTVRNSSMSVIGSYTEKMVNLFSCSKLFLGVDGIDVDFGLTTTNAMEANLHTEMIKSAQKLIVLTDSSKFGKRGVSRICDLSYVDQIITDDAISSVELNKLLEQGIDVVTVSS